MNLKNKIAHLTSEETKGEILIEFAKVVQAKKKKKNKKKKQTKFFKFPAHWQEFTDVAIVPVYKDKN